MRIALVTNFYYPEMIGGAEHSTKYLAEKLVELGNEVHVICTGNEASKEIINGVIVNRFKTKSICRAHKAKYHSMPIRLIRRVQDIYNPFNYPLLKKLIIAISPDVIHMQSIIDVTPVVWKIAKQLGIRCVYTLRDYNFLCPKTTLVCYHANGECFKPIIPCSIFRRLNKYNERNLDAVTFLSYKMREIVFRHGFFKNINNYIVPNAIPYDITEIQQIITYREKRLIGHGTVRFVYLGNLSRIKGVFWLFKAFEKLPGCDCELYLAGRGELENFVKQKANENENIKFMGFQNEQGVSELLKKADVLMATSLWHEPFGRVVLDAYKHGMPVISSNRGALPELVKNEHTGFVIEGNDVEGLQNAMQYYIDYPHVVIEHGINAMRKLKDFSLDKQAEAFLEIYKS